jgi:hypothetical protein
VIVCGVVCAKDSFSYSVLLDDGSVEDHEVEAPSSMTSDRPETLVWLADEAQRLFEAHAVSEVRIWAAQAGGRSSPSRERYESEACVQIAAHRAGATVQMLSKEKVRAAYGVARGKGAFDTLLKRDDVQARRNETRRQQYLMVKAPTT